MRARHVISENLRTVAACEALLKGDMKELGRLMAEAHRSYSKDFEGSCVEADAMVELAQDLPGLIGARLTGGGFGGCTINLVEQSEAAKFAEALGARYAARPGSCRRFTSAMPREGRTGWSNRKAASWQVSKSATTDSGAGEVQRESGRISISISECGNYLSCLEETPASN